MIVKDTPVAVEIFVLIDGLCVMLRNDNEVAVRIGFEYLWWGMFGEHAWRLVNARSLGVWASRCTQCTPLGLRHTLWPTP